MIEKDEITLDLYRRELSKSFGVQAATKIDEAMAALTRGGIQAVIIEPETGARQGWELIRTIDTAFPDCSMPIIVCSTRDARNLDLPASVRKYLVKPVLPKRLKETALQVLEMNSKAA